MSRLNQSMKENSRLGVIYMITNVTNKKVYIGQSVNVEKRLKQHRREAYNKKNKIYNYHLYCSIRKYGWDNFEVTILRENICHEDLDTCEIAYIEYFDSCNPQKGYNDESSFKQQDG